MVDRVNGHGFGGRPGEIPPGVGQGVRGLASGPGKQVTGEKKGEARGVNEEHAIDAAWREVAAAFERVYVARDVGALYDALAKISKILERYGTIALRRVSGCSRALVKASEITKVWSRSKFIELMTPWGPSNRPVPWTLLVEVSRMPAFYRDELLASAIREGLSIRRVRKLRWAKERDYARDIEPDDESVAGGGCPDRPADRLEREHAGQAVDMEERLPWLKSDVLLAAINEIEEQFDCIASTLASVCVRLRMIVEKRAV